MIKGGYMLTRRAILKTSFALGALPGVLPGFLARTARAQGVAPVHGLAMHGEPKYGPGFAHFDYVNPQAPRGGRVRQSGIGTYDSFNGFIVKGTPAGGLGFVFETLTTQSSDEAFSEYGLIAETIEMPEDRSWVGYNLHPQARWHDGKPITIDDVIFTFETLKTKGHPFYRAYYANVDKAEQTGERQVRFSFSGGVNRELPLIMGQMTVLPKHYWEGRDFEAVSLDIPLGSGPYKIESFQAGRSVTYRRVPDYWGADLPINVGQNNWDEIHVQYYLDAVVALEAFKAGDYDIRVENSAKNWATAYDVPAVRDGRLIKAEIKHEIPTGMQCYVFNTRREIFKDRRVRQALAYAFDFEWSNINLFFGQYTRTASYFSNSELASSGLPSAEELAILEPLRGQIPDEVFTATYEPPATDGSGNIRANLRKGLDLLKAAGFEVRNGVAINAATGKPLECEILLVAGDLFERITQPFVQNLERLGVKARIRNVDSAQYQVRNETFDFDMIVETFGQSLSPGNEQRDFWGSASADVRGGRNTIGIKDPVVDRLIDLIIAAADRESLITRCRALDRVLLWGHYVIPHWHIAMFRVAYWNKFGRPPINPKYALATGSWWVDPELDAALANRSN
jgi:microcin C transport system substrate-binding protein